MLAEGETDGDEVGIVVDGLHYVATNIGAAGTGTAATGADVVDVEVEEYHIAFFSPWYADTQYGVEAAAGNIAVETDAGDVLEQLLHHV